MGYTPHDSATSMENPDWVGAEKVHDWRNHVGPNTRAIWHTLTLEPRLAIAADAELNAGKEEWD